MTENNPNQPTERTWTEAPASFTIKYLMGGYDCMLTLRGENGGDVLTKAEQAVKWLTEHSAGPNANNHKPTAPEQPAPQSNGAPKPAGGSQPQKPNPEDGETVTFDVKTMAHCVTDNGAHYVRIKGGKFSKFGAKAWPEVLPQEAQEFQDWEIGQEFTPFDSMKHATVTGSKVTKFTA